MSHHASEEVEGRLIALRQMVAQVMAAQVIGPDARAAMTEELLHETFLPADQQSPPEGMPKDASPLERAALDEKRRVVQEAGRLVKVHRGTPNAGAGPSRAAPPDVEEGGGEAG